MMGEIVTELKERLAQGPLRIGQIVCRSDFSIRHDSDTDETQGPIFMNPYQASEIAKYDDEGNFRPLKTAPNLRRGWRLELGTLEEMRMAIDFFYPLALSAILAFRRKSLPVSSLRDVLARQTGMYAVTKKVTDEEADTIVRKLCNSESGCLRHVLWRISSDRPSSLSEDGRDIRTDTSEVPLLCPEACCLIVAETRTVVKARPATVEPSSQM